MLIQTSLPKLKVKTSMPFCQHLILSYFRGIFLKWLNQSTNIDLEYLIKHAYRRKTIGRIKTR